MALLSGEGIGGSARLGLAVESGAAAGQADQGPSTCRRHCRQRGEYITGVEASANRAVRIGKVTCPDLLVARMQSEGMEEKKGLESGGEGGEAEEAAHLFPFGSYRLDVHDPSSDLDLLVVAPRLIGREDFFTSFRDALAQHHWATEVCPVPEAYTPVIKFRMNGESVAREEGAHKDSPALACR